MSFDFDNYYTFNETLAELSEQTIINNTIVLEYKSQFDILCHKYVYQVVDDQTMHHLQWEELYKKYCDPEFIISTKTILLDKIFLSPYRVKARCRFIKFLEPFIILLYGKTIKLMEFTKIFRC